jgi:uncharacterized protein YndB with AHSA1/START domain
MAQISKSEPGPIRFERVYDAPVGDLWALWTTKEGLEEWFAPEGCHVEVPALDVRVGGAFDQVMTAVGDDAVAYMASAGRSRTTRVRGHFVEVVPHTRLHIRLTMDFLPGVEPYPYDILVEFHAAGERVRMVVTADLHPDVEMTRLATQGLASQLRQFDLVLASRGRRAATWKGPRTWDS